MKRGDQALFSCVVGFQLPESELTYSWKFAGGGVSRDRASWRAEGVCSAPGEEEAKCRLGVGFSARAGSGTIEGQYTEGHQCLDVRYESGFKGCLGQLREPEARELTQGLG